MLRDNIFSDDTGNTIIHDLYLVRLLTVFTQTVSGTARDMLQCFIIKFTYFQVFHFIPSFFRYFPF